MSEPKLCVVCGEKMSAAYAEHSDRCKDCDHLPVKDRVELTVRTRTAAFLGLIAGELSEIRKALQRLAGGVTEDEQGPEAKTNTKK